MSALQIFRFPVTSQDVRVKGDLNDPWFHLGDICAVLGIANPSDVADRLDDEDKARLNLGLPGQIPWFVNESGLYDVVLRSDKPIAKTFRRWVTSEVLRSIRKTGQYTAKPADIKTFQSMGLPSEMIGIIGAIDNNLDDPVAVAHYAAALNALQNVFSRDKDTTPSTTSQSLPTAALEGLDADQAYIMRYLAKRGKPATLNDIYKNRHFQNKKMNSVAVRAVMESMTDKVKFEAGKGYSLI